MQNHEENKFPAALSSPLLDDPSNVNMTKWAQEYYEINPYSPRTVAEAMDEYQNQVMRGKAYIVGSRDAPWSETTREAVSRGVFLYGVVHEDLDSDGHGGVLLYTPPSGENGGALRLAVWDTVTDTHYMADVSAAVRVNCPHEHNEFTYVEFSDTEQSGYNRYVLQARAITEGTRIVYQGVVRTVVGFAYVPLTGDPPDVGDYKNMIRAVRLEFACGLKIHVPGALEITYVDVAGNGR